MSAVTGRLLRAEEVDDDLAQAWDALPAGRGTQADFQDSHTWYAAWLASVPPATAARVRVAVVGDVDQPLAVLPFVTRGSRFEVVGARRRPRTRPAVATPDPDPEVLAVLARTLAGAGARQLGLHRMPSHDPATRALLDGLRSAGYHVVTTELSSDRLAPAPDGWEAYRTQLAGFDRYARRFANRLRSQWDVELELYGTPDGRPVAEGFRIFEEVQQRSWKQGFAPDVRTQWSGLFEGADRRGWVRVYVLRVAGVAAAVHVWFRVGEVATWYATAYDQQMAVLSPGTVVQWWSQERLFAEPDPPRLVDLMPGTTPQKDRLTLEQPPLLKVDAVLQRGRWSAPAFELALAVSGARATARQRLGTRRQAWAQRRRERAAAPPPPDVRVPPAQDEAPVAALDGGDAALRRYLALAGGWSGTEAMTREWDDGDTWWSVGETPSAMVRLREPDRVVEVVRVPGEARTAQRLSALVARHHGRTLVLTGGLVAHDPPLPWPVGGG